MELGQLNPLNDNPHNCAIFHRMMTETPPVGKHRNARARTLIQKLNANPPAIDMHKTVLGFEGNFPKEAPVFADDMDAYNDIVNEI